MWAETRSKLASKKVTFILNEKWNMTEPNITQTACDRQPEQGEQAEVAKRQSSSGVKPYMKAPIDDNRWVRQQSSTVKDLWLDCWYSDPYGSQWMPLETTLKPESLKKAKKVLRDAGLFDFETRVRMVNLDRIYQAYVKNLHGEKVRHSK